MRTLRRGDTGADVQAVAEALIALGFMTKAPAKLTAAMEKAVRAFQTSAGLIPDGLAGRRTKNALHQRAGRQVQQLIVHHSASPRSTTVEAIKAFHQQHRGWSDVAYHTLLRQVEGTSLVEVAPGRGYDGDGFLSGPEVGAGVLGSANFHALQICLIGNFDENDVPAEMWGVLVFWLAAQCAALGLGTSDVVGHREIEGQRGTVCPGGHVDLAALRADVGAALLTRATS